MLNCFSYSKIIVPTFQKGTVPVVTEIVVAMYVELFQLFQDIVPNIPIGDCASGHRDCCHYVC